MTLAVLVMACATPPPEDTTSDEVADLWWTQDPTEPTTVVDSFAPPTGTGYNGEIPEELIPPPVFTAYNRDGTERTQADLIGQPTALWFYPRANTNG